MRLWRAVPTGDRAGTVWMAIAAQQAARSRAPRDVEGPIVPLSLQELLVRPGFGDVAVHEHDDLGVPGDRVVPMGGENDDLVGQLREEREDGAFALRVEDRGS
jgi:hypothetical protein